MGRAGTLLTVFLLAACGSVTDDLPAQMQTAVEDYLAGRGGLAANNMEVSVDAVRVDGNRAQVEVTIAASNDAAAVMQMVYELEKALGPLAREAFASGRRNGAARGRRVAARSSAA